MARKAQSPPKSFEEALRELEEILSEIERGELGLEESLLKYERGNFLIQHCRGVLNGAEKQIELLSKSPDGGISRSPLVPSDAPAGLDAGAPPAGGIAQDSSEDDLSSSDAAEAQESSK